MTEAEAATKWCPFAIKIGTLTDMSGTILASGGQNRGHTMDGPLPASMCISSACMAWRTRSVPVAAPYDPDSAKKTSVAPQPSAFAGTMKVIGYCGLAGPVQ